MRNRIPLAPLITLLLIVLIGGIPACGGSKNTNPVTPPATKELDSGNIPSGGTYQHTFSNAGTYNYFCTIHGANIMSGSVTVAPSGPPTSASVSIQNNSYSPASVSVGLGGMVTWTNNGSPHTVTSN